MNIQSGLETSDFTIGDRVRIITHIDGTVAERTPTPVYAEGTIVGVYHGVGTVDVHAPAGLGNRYARRPWNVEKIG
jgi:ribosomal protein L21E